MPATPVGSAEPLLAHDHARGWAAGDDGATSSRDGKLRSTSRLAFEPRTHTTSIKPYTGPSYEQPVLHRSSELYRVQDTVISSHTSLELVVSPSRPARRRCLLPADRWRYESGERTHIHKSRTPHKLSEVRAADGHTHVRSMVRVISFSTRHARASYLES